VYCPAASSALLRVIPCLTEPAPYLIRGNPVRFSGFRLEFIPHWMLGRNDGKSGKPLGLNPEGFNHIKVRSCLRIGAKHVHS
jgi:hypothetical protein